MKSSPARSINRRIPTGVGVLAVADHGAGTPVVLWPSLFSDHRLYGWVTGLLGSKWRTICVDGPGFGLSAAPVGDVQPDQYADALVEVLDALEVERAIAAGCSWGGQVAAHFGARVPRRTHGVLMMNTPLMPSLGAHRREVFGTRWFGSTRFWGRGVARSMFAPATGVSHPERVEAFVAACGSFDRAAAATTVRTVLSRSAGLEEVLPRLEVPVTIMMGADDRLAAPDQALAAARRTPGVRIEVVPQCGHLAPLEVPEAVVAELEAIARAHAREVHSAHGPHRR